MELLRELLRARALEALLAREVSDPGLPVPHTRPVSPALPAARALKRATDGTGDVFSLRIGSPAAALAMGLTPHQILRQELGRGTAPAQGRDPGGFPTDLDRGLLAPFAIPGILVEVLGGVALAFRLRGEKRVALLVDDVSGSASGDWHEGLNFAAVREAPLVLVVDHTHRKAMDAPVPTTAQRADAYGFRAHTVEGTDPRAVEKVIWTAVEAARTGGGVQVVDVTRPATDPVVWLGENQVGVEALTREGLDALAAEAEVEMEEALVRVQAEPDPEPLEALATPGRSWPPAGWSPWAPAAT